MNTILVKARSLSAWIALLLFAFPTLAAAAPGKSISEKRNEELLLRSEYVLNQCSEYGWKQLGIYALISTAASMLLFWPASKLVVGTKGRFTNALSYWALLTVVSGVWLLLSIIAIRQNWPSLISAMGLGILFAFVGGARTVYEVSVGRAIGLAICALFIGGVAVGITDGAMGATPWSEFDDKTPEQQQAILAEFRMKKRESERKEVSPAVPTPVPTVHELYADLQKSRAELNVNDPAAVARFNEKVAAYNAANAAAKAIASPSPSPVTSKAAKSSSKKDSPRKKAESAGG